MRGILFVVQLLYVIGVVGLDCSVLNVGNLIAEAFLVRAFTNNAYVVANGEDILQVCVRYVIVTDVNVDTIYEIRFSVVLFNENAVAGLVGNVALKRHLLAVVFVQVGAQFAKVDFNCRAVEEIGVGVVGVYVQL